MSHGMKPADLDGWWLNLPKALDRATSMRTNLKALALENHYKRFEAGLGNPSAAAARELAVGEAGAWCSWLRLLEQASRSEAAIVHLLEDDTELTEGLEALLRWDGLHSLLAQGAIVCTDGYVSPSQARLLLTHPSWSQGWQCITEGLPVPCIGSMLATPSTWQQAHQQLQHHWDAGEKLAPIDLMMGQIQDLRVVTVAPFATIPRMDLARCSHIRQTGDTGLERSREALTLLRRLLRWPTTGAEETWDGAWELFWRSQPVRLQEQAVLDALEGLVQRGHLKPY